MNVQAHMSGQISGQVPNQIPQQNVNSVQPQMQNFGGVGGLRCDKLPMDAELIKARNFMRQKICGILESRHSQPLTDAQKMKFMDIVKRLEEGLFKSAPTKEDYMNVGTLGDRLQLLIRRSTMNRNQQYQQHVNSSSSIGTMIPTPGMLHGGNSNMMVTSAVDTTMVSASNNMASTNVNAGSLLPTGNGPSMGVPNVSFSAADGSGILSNGYQQSSSNFSVASGGNQFSSLGGQRMTSQMIPTPGFNSNNNQSNTSVDSTNGGALSTTESSMVSQQAKQHAAVQNDHILHRFGSHTGSGIRSGLQQKSYGFLNGGMGINVQPVNGPTASEGYLNAAPYANSSNPLQQRFDQQQRPLIQGDGFGVNNADPPQPGNFYGTVTSVAPMMNTQNLSSVNLQSMSNTSTSLMNNQLNIHTFQHAEDGNPQLVDHSEKINFQSSSSGENLLHRHHQQQLQRQPHQLQPQQKIIRQDQLKLQNHHNQIVLKNNATGRIQLSSNLGTQVKPEAGMDDHGSVMQQHVSEQHQLPKSQNQFVYGDDCSRGAAQSTLSQNSQRMPQLQPQVVSEIQSDYSSTSGAQPECKVENQWHHPQSQERTQMSGNMLYKQHVQEDFCQRISKQDEAQPNKLASEGSNVNQTVASRSSVVPPNSGGGVCGPGNANREKQFRNQRRWLLFLRHARHCTSPEGKCPEYHCITVQRLWKHMESCNSPQCSYPRCYVTQALLVHNKNCRNPVCPVCVPVRNYIIQQRIRHNHRTTGITAERSPQRTASESNEDLNPLKRAKLARALSPIPEEEKSVSNSDINKSHVSEDVQQQDHCHGEMNMSIKSEATEMTMGIPVNSAQAGMAVREMEEDKAGGLCDQLPDGEPNESDELAEVAKQENVKVEKETEVPKQENVPESADNGTGTKSGKPKIKGVSLTELFTPEQVREHIRGLRQWVGQSKAKAEKHQAMERSMSENSCQLCAVEKLTFEPPPIYCTLCGARIKRNAMYYTVGAGDTRHYFCIPCYNESRGDTIAVEGASIPKARLEKKKNDEETEEWWVQCDKCEAWQHQICALFNGRRNDGGQAEYTCPYCYIKEVESGERKPLPQSAVLGAKDLPTTALSDHIEQRLFRKLKQERQDRAKLQGKRYDEVPGAEALVIRVVSSVDKKLEVKPRFLEIFQEENYPTEFPYKSKVVLLFQKIEGVEVCLFGMYVQEFGSECAFPNKRRVYLSYLDSVKYFRPEVRAVTGEALRTFVYHEILIGYLEYCKIRGFTSCYIWACPPLKGEDYILYCHPEIQKTPKSDKLREWYLSMLRKAAKENIVVELTNMYDHFFTQIGECKAKVTAARLPYFDGDYWPGAAEDMIYQMQQEEEGRKYNKKGSIKKTITKRALKASGQSDLSGNASKDLLLMHKLGETISPMKEDFIMVHLQHCCKHCCILMVSGICWVCQQCKNFRLCDKCYGAEQNREDRERHPINHKEKHSFNPVEITDVAAETRDEDEILESEFFDTRQAFLSLCQGNHYQYDTLRRAKHSSMMVLYHLHNPTAPAFVTTCNVCHLDIETGQGWRCEVCPDYDVCNACYQNDGGINHPHKLTNHPSIADRDAQNKEARQLRVEQLRKMLELLVHASQCRSPQCQYPNCRKVKQLFRHGIHCRVRASGGCVLCKKMWYLLQLHARACKESQCHVPRCRDLREHLRRLQQQSDSRRRAAVMEMMRQRAAEVAGNAG